MPRSRSNRAARQKDKDRKRREREKISKAFVYCTVDESWKNDCVEQLQLSQPQCQDSSQSNNMPLTLPTVFRKTIGDGNCFFRCISYIITGTEDFHYDIRLKICEYLKTHSIEVKGILPNEAKGSVDTYLENSHMERLNTWATEVEIFVTSLLLKTNIYVFTKHGVQWTWIRHSSENVVSDKAIYLLHKNLNHFDVVLGVQNVSASFDYMHDPMCYCDENIKNTMSKRNKVKRKKTANNTHSRGDKGYAKKQCTSPQISSNKSHAEKHKQYSKQKYEQDEVFRRKKLKRSKTLYTGNKDYREKKIQMSKHRYAQDCIKIRAYVKNKYSEDESFRQKKQKSSKQKYGLDKNYREKIKNLSKQKYRIDKNHREKVKKLSKQKYRLNKNHRENLKKLSKQKYLLDENYRRKRKNLSKLKYLINENHRNAVISYSKRKYLMNEVHRQKVKEHSRMKYRENKQHRLNVQQYSKYKYHTFDSFRNNVKASSVKKYAKYPLFRKVLKDFLMSKYHQDIMVQQTKKDRVKLSRQSVIKGIQKFRKSVSDPIHYICTVCIRILYRSQVKACKREKYAGNTELCQNAEKCLTGLYVHTCENMCKQDCSLKKADRDQEWICHTCDRHLKSGSMPPQALVNHLSLPDIPPVLKKLNVLERQLVAMRIPFMKLLSLPRGGQKGVKGPVVNVPSDLSTVTTSLPRHFEEAHLIKVKLKRKLAYKGHYKYQWIDPANVFNAVKYLIQHNTWYNKVSLDDSWWDTINSSELVCPENQDNENGIDDESDEDDIKDTHTDPQDIQKDAQKNTQSDAQKDEQMDTKKDAQMDAQKDEQKDTKKDAQKNREKDAQMGAQRDAQMDAQRDVLMDAQKDEQKDTKKDAQMDAQIDAEKDAQKDEQKDTKKDAQKNTQKDAQMGAQRDAQMDAQKDEQKDTKKGAQKNTQKGAQMDAEKDAQMGAQRDAQMDAQKDEQKDTKKGAQKNTQKGAQMDAEKDVQMDAQKDAQMKAQKGVHKDKQKNEQSIPVETCFQPVDIGQATLDTSLNTLCLAPAEKQTPQNIFQEIGSDAMAFPVLLPNGRFGLFEERDVKLSPAKYFNTRLFSADDRFSTDKEFIFFAQYVTELNQISSNISLALRKGKETTEDDKKLTASMLLNSEKVAEILKADVGYRFLQPVRGTPPYWQRTMKDLFSMIRQLGIPTWFVTFSAAEMRWEEVTNTLLFLNNDSRHADDVEWSEKSKMVAENPVICARMFDHRVKALFSNLILSPSSPIGNVVDFFFRTEFQQRGSPHIHCLFWVKNAPKLNENTDEEICDFIDQYITCKMPEETADPELHDIVSTVQVHSKSHSKSCKKYSSGCRFKFPRPPVHETFIANPKFEETDLVDKTTKPLTAEELDKMSKNAARNSREILRDVWSLLSDDQCNLPFEDILKLVNVTYSDFKQSLQDIATRNTVHLQRQQSDMWVNNYNETLLRAWNANMDIQYVTDPYACVAYIISYISKAETEMGDLLKNAKEEAEEGNASVRDAMKKIGSVYMQNREISAQEAVYRVCSLHLKDCSREVVFVPAGKNILKMSLPVNIIKARSYQGVEEDIWMPSVHEKYYARPDCNEFINMCLAEFSSHFRFISKSQRPKKSKHCLPTYELQKQFGFIQKRKEGKEAVVRYPRFKLHKNSEDYYLSLIQLYLPHRSPIVLSADFHSYEEYVRTGNIGDETIFTVIERNRHMFEIDADKLDNAWEDFQEGRVSEDSWAQLAPETESERIEIRLEKKIDDGDGPEDVPELSVSNNQNSVRVQHTVEYQPPKFPKHEIQHALRLMNAMQEKLFYTIRKWCQQLVWQQNPDPFQVFLTGGAGTGKSHVVKCIYYESTRILSKFASSPDSLCVLLTAPTGTAAFNIGGLTIHSAFSINKKVKLPYQPLGESLLNTLRTKYESLQILIIDEISMVDQKLLHYIHGRLCQLKHSKKPFGGVSVLAVGDFYQLPPVRAHSLYKQRDSNFYDLWNTHFAIVTLTEVMRQKGDQIFAALLNRIRTHKRGNSLLAIDDKALLNVSYQHLPEKDRDILHIFPTNKEVENHNSDMIKIKCSPVFVSTATDFYRDVVTGKRCQKHHPVTKCAPEDLQTVLTLGTGARVMLTRNIDTDDGLVNGAFGTITGVEHKSENQVTAVSVKFDNPKVGQKKSKLSVLDPWKRGTVKIKPIEETLCNNKNLTRKQFPFKLGWAATIHKVQGMTVPDVVVSLKRVFAPGMAYVALSRATTIKGLRILDYNSDAIYSSEDITDGLQKMPQFLPGDTATSTTDSFCIIHHNTEGLIPHLEDIKHMNSFENCPVICFTETWLKTNQVPTSLLPGYDHYKILRKDAYTVDKPVFAKLGAMDKGGVAIFIRKNVHHSPIAIRTQNLEVTACILEKPLHALVATVYRPPMYPNQLFTSNISSLLAEIDQLKIPSVVLGDFNDNSMQPSDSFVVQTFSAFGYSQLVNGPTTESGSLLDLIFVKDISNTVTADILPTHYSFHDAVKLSISQ